MVPRWHRPDDAGRSPSLRPPPRITNPVSGSVYAVDPDIPVGQQALGVGLSGTGAAYRLTLDGRPLGIAQDGAQLPLIPGSHLLALADESGRAVDTVRFTVR